MEAILLDLESDNLDIRKQALLQLIELSGQYPGPLPIPNMIKFFQLISIRIRDKEIDIVSSCLQLLISITPDFGPELETVFVPVIPSLLEKLAENRLGISKSVVRCLKGYIQETRNVDNVIKFLIHNGIMNEDWKLRQASLVTVCPVIQSDMSYLNSTAEIGKLLETMLLRLRDTSIQVKTTAKETIKELMGMIQDPQRILNRLSFNYQNLYKDEILETAASPPPQPPMMQQRAPAILNLGNSFAPDMVWGFIPQDMMRKLEEVNNWRARVAAIQELENLVNRLTSFDFLIPYSQDFVRFLNGLLEDSNFKITISALELIYKIISNIQINLNTVFPNLLNKLGDNKIAIRQSAFRIFFQLIKNEPNPNALFNFFIESLTSANWHIREEVVSLIVAAILSNTEYQYLKLVIPLLNLIDDSRAKIRFVTYECVALIAKMTDVIKVRALAQEYLDEQAMQILNNTIISRQTPYLREDYVEYPKNTPSSSTYSISTATSKAATPAVDKDREDYTNYQTTNFAEFEATFSPQRETPNMLRLRKNETPPTDTSGKFGLLKSKNSDAARTGSVDTYSTAPSRIIKATKPPALKQDTRPPSMPTRVSKNYGTGIFQRKVDIRNTSSSGGFMRDSEPSSPPPLTTNSTQKSPMKVLRQPNEQPSMFSQDTTSYLTTEELTPMDHPERSMLPAIKVLQANDWAQQFDALNTIRRVVRFHHKLVVSHISNLFGPLLKLADSLRSSLAKNALITIGEIATTMNRQIDSNIDNIVPLLLKKCADTNIFISEEAENSMVALCINCSEGRCLSSLVNHSTNTRTAAIKAKTAYFFEVVFQRVKGQALKLREIDRVLHTLAIYTSDANVEVRNNSKSALKALTAYAPIMELEKVLQRGLTEANMQRIREVLYETGAGSASPMRRNYTRGGIQSADKPEMRKTEYVSRASARPGATVKSAGFRKTPSRNYEKEPLEFEQISLLTSNMNNSNWNTRFETINTIVSLVTNHKDAVLRSSKLVHVVDIMCKGCLDNNLKVVIHSLGSLMKVLPLIGQGIDLHLNLIVTTLAGALSSGNASVRNLARDVFDCLSENTDHNSLIVPLTQATASTNIRAKPVLIAIIDDLTVKMYATKSTAVHKYVVPLAYRLMDDTKVEIRNSIQKLLSILHDHMGSLLVEMAPSSKVQKVMDVLKNK